MADGSVTIDTKLDGSGLKEGLAGLAGTVASGISAAVAAATAALSAATAAVIAYGSSFETAMAKVSTLADTSVVSMDELQAGILSLSSQVGQSADGLSEALYQALSASVDTAEAVEFVGTASKLAIGGFTETATRCHPLSTHTEPKTSPPRKQRRS